MVRLALHGAEAALYQHRQGSQVCLVSWMQSIMPQSSICNMLVATHTIWNMSQGQSRPPAWPDPAPAQPQNSQQQQGQSACVALAVRENAEQQACSCVTLGHSLCSGSFSAKYHMMAPLSNTARSPAVWSHQGWDPAGVTRFLMCNIHSGGIYARMTQQSLPHLPLGLILRNHGSFCSFFAQADGLQLIWIGPVPRW